MVLRNNKDNAFKELTFSFCCILGTQRMIADLGAAGSMGLSLSPGTSTLFLIYTHTAVSYKIIIVTLFGGHMKDFLNFRVPGHL